MELVLSEKMNKSDFCDLIKMTGLMSVGFSEFVVYRNYLLKLISELPIGNRLSVIALNAIGDAEEIKIDNYFYKYS